jgi:hypothetical protein
LRVLLTFVDCSGKLETFADSPMRRGQKHSNRADVGPDLIASRVLGHIACKLAAM